MSLTDIFTFAFNFLRKPKVYSRQPYTMKKAVAYLFALSVVSAIISDLILFIQGSDVNTLTGTPILFIGSVFVEVFVVAGLTHIFGKLLHYFKKGFTKTFVATTYGNTFLALFTWIGSISFLSGLSISQVFSIVAIFYTYYAVMSQQNVDSKKAIIAVVLPYILFLVLTIFIAGIAYVYISGLG
jgi:hypothetical protein